MTQPSPYFIRRTSLPEDSDPADNRVNFFDDDEGRIDFNQYWRTIRKHLSMIVAIFVAVTLLTLIKLLMETPMYTAEATILIKPGTPQIFGNQVSNNNEDTDGQSDDYETYNKTQYEILKSRSLAASAISDEGLEKVLTPNAGKPRAGCVRARSSISSRVYLFDQPSNQSVPAPHAEAGPGSGRNRHLSSELADQAGTGHQPGQHSFHDARREPVGAAGQCARARLHPAGNRAAQPGE